VSAPTLSIAFFDPQHGLHGTARRGATLLFEGSSSNVLPEGPEVQADGEGWRAELQGAFSLTFAPVADPARLGGVTVNVCTVRGTVGAQAIDCLGTVAETTSPPAWEELDAMRSISAVFDAEHAFLAVSKRPRDAGDHGVEQAVGWLLTGGEPHAVEETRISTIYDGEGRQRSCGLELWMPGEEYPRRCSGTVVAGSSLSLDGLDVHAAVFRWRMEDREGTGNYEVWVRRQADEAA
jgi:hypothetical protein